MPFSLTYSVLRAVLLPAGEVVVRQLEERTS